MDGERGQGPQPPFIFSQPIDPGRAKFTVVQGLEASSSFYEVAEIHPGEDP